MGYSVTGQLSFGIDIGNEEDDYGFPDAEGPAWAKAPDAIEEAERLLYASVGFDDDVPAADRDDEFHIARRQATYRLGVAFQRYGLADYTSWMLVGLHMRASGGGPTEVTPADLTLPDRMLDQFRHASGVLGLESRKPRWMLTGLYA